jgi:hypothetical protein
VIQTEQILITENPPEKRFNPTNLLDEHMPTLPGPFLSPERSGMTEPETDIPRFEYSAKCTHFTVMRNEKTDLKTGYKHPYYTIKVHGTNEIPVDIDNVTVKCDVVTNFGATGDFFIGKNFVYHIYVMSLLNKVITADITVVPDDPKNLTNMR